MRVLCSTERLVHSGSQFLAPVKIVNSCYIPFTSEVLVVIGKGSGITSHSRANLTVSPQLVMHDLAVKFVQELSTSTARFFVAEPLLVLVSLSLSGVSLRLSGLLA